MVGTDLAPMIADIKRVSQLFQGFKSTDMLEIPQVLNSKEIHDTWQEYLFELFALKANTFLLVELFSWFLFFNLLCGGAKNIYQFTLTIEQ